MAIDSIQTQTSVDTNGNAYTTSVSNDNLTNQDFLKLLLVEMQMQDPTQPMDSSKMLDSQMQMSTIETNLKLATSMESLQTSFAQSALSTAANVIGKHIEDGNTSDSGYNKAYTVRSVENIDGEVYVKAQEILFLEDNISDKDGNPVSYDLNGYILDAAGEKTGYMITLTNPGEVALDDNNKPIILDAEGEIVEDDDTYDYSMAGTTTKVYSDQLVSVPFSSVTKIF